MSNEVINQIDSSSIVRMDQSLLLRPVAPIQDLLAAQEERTQIVVKMLKEGVDYGQVPGTKTKPSLFKAGAERLNITFGCTPKYEIVEQDVDHFREVPWQKSKKVWNNAHRGDKTFVWATEEGKAIGLYRFVTRCALVSRMTGDVVAEGIGSCSSLEAKYCDRPRECENTILKMAQKRALVAAALNAYGLSDRFTQDVEDMDRSTLPADQGESHPIQDAEYREIPAEDPPVPQAELDRRACFAILSDMGVPYNDANKPEILIFLSKGTRKLYESSKAPGIPWSAKRKVLTEWQDGNREIPTLDALRAPKAETNGTKAPTTSSTTTSGETTPVASDEDDVFDDI